MPERWVYPDATLHHVVDGDSFYANVSRELDFGFHVKVRPSAVQKFRLNGCNAAPLSTPSGQLARDFALKLLLLGPFTLTSVGPYKYGDTWLAEITLADGKRLTDLMVAEQWAMPWNGQGPAPLPPWPRTLPEAS